MWHLWMKAKPPVGVHDAGTIAGIGDGVGEGVDVPAGVGPAVDEAGSDGVRLGAGLAAAEHATTRSVAPINAESRDGERPMVCVLLPVVAERRAGRPIAASLSPCRHPNRTTGGACGRLG